MFTRMRFGHILDGGIWQPCLIVGEVRLSHYQGGDTVTVLWQGVLQTAFACFVKTTEG